MTRLLTLAALLAAPLAAAQDGDPALAATADRLRDDAGHVTRVVSAAALAHEATGAFPDTPFALLAGPWATGTDLRGLALSSLTVAASGDRLEVTYVPLPRPYVREDRVVTLTVTPDGDTYRGAYTVERREDPDLGGGPLPYDTAGRYRVERASGTVCVDAGRAAALVARGAYEPDPALLSDEPVVVRVRPLGEPGPVLYREGGEPAGR
jgi:hypothetical protein